MQRLKVASGFGAHLDLSGMSLHMIFGRLFNSGVLRCLDLSSAALVSLFHFCVIWPPFGGP